MSRQGEASGAPQKTRYVFWGPRLAPTGVIISTSRPFLRLFVSPAVLCALALAAALAAVTQYSVRAYVPGSLDPGGFTLDNFTALTKPLYARVFLDTSVKVERDWQRRAHALDRLGY